VIEVSEGSPADKAGFKGAEESATNPKGGDLIVAIDGLDVMNFDDFMGYLLTYKKPGDEVVITVIRDGEALDLDLILGKRP
jgi:S1-C subfamily serine protease